MINQPTNDTNSLGTITSLTGSGGITVTPSPITSTGVISLTNPSESSTTNLIGTANQVILSNSGTNVLNGSLPITLSLPQSIATTSNVTFGGATLTGVTLNGKVTTYNSITTVSGGIPSELATIDSTGLGAAVTATTLYTPVASGMFRISVILHVTTVGDVSSILGGTTGVVITYTEPDGSVAQSLTVGMFDQSGNVITVGNGNVGNVTTTSSQGTAIIQAKTGVAIQYAIGYTSVNAGIMKYSAHFKCEAM